MQQKQHNEQPELWNNVYIYFLTPMPPPLYTYYTSELLFTKERKSRMNESSWNIFSADISIYILHQGVILCKITRFMAKCKNQRGEICIPVSSLSSTVSWLAPQGFISRQQRHKNTMGLHQCNTQLDNGGSKCCLSINISQQLHSGEQCCE